MQKKTGGRCGFSPLTGTFIKNLELILQKRLSNMEKLQKSACNIFFHDVYLSMLWHDSYDPGGCVWHQNGISGERMSS